jgi:choloylglycine hydrolase
MLATEYPPADGRPAANEVQWIQYQLDNFETVEQVIASDEKIRIGQNSTQLHYMVCDRYGNTAAIEFLHGKMKVYTGDRMPVRVLTNSTYEQSLEYLDRPDSNEYDFSLVRFKIATEKVRQYYKNKPEAIIDYSFDILESVCFDPQSKFSTKWSIVYDIENMKIYFKTLAHPAIKTIEINNLDFTCGQSSPVLDMAIEEAGDVTDDFIDYTTEMNRDLIMNTFGIFKARGFLDIADSLLWMLSEYPAGMPCQDTLDR